MDIRPPESGFCTAFSTGLFNLITCLILTSGEDSGPAGPDQAADGPGQEDDQAPQDQEYDGIQGGQALVFLIPIKQ